MCWLCFLISAGEPLPSSTVTRATPPPFLGNFILDGGGGGTGKWKIELVVSTIDDRRPTNCNQSRCVCTCVDGSGVLLCHCVSAPVRRPLCSGFDVPTTNVDGCSTTKLVFSYATSI